MRRLLMLACCLALSACYPAGKRGGDSALAVYDFGPPAPISSAIAPRSGLALEVRAPLWMDSLDIGYRLAYAEPARLRDYTRARWAGPPAQLIQQHLLRELGLRPAGQGGSNCVLRVDIDEFVQVFVDATDSHGLVQGRAQLLDRRRSLVKAYEFRIEKPAPTPDSRGGVAALTAAVDQLGRELAAWEKALPGKSGTSDCPA